MKYNYELNYKRIKMLRLKRKLTQKSIAKLLNISQPTYSKIERSKTNITIEHLNRLSNYYNVSLDYLLNLSDIDNIDIINIDLNKELIGKRLKNIRKESNLYQKALAEELDTGQSLISEYESGKRLINLNYGYFICKKYNISMDYLYGKTNIKEIKKIS